MTTHEKIQTRQSSTPTPTPTAPTRERERPAWAQTVHYFGDDLRWVCSGWCDFPRPIGRVSTAIVSAGTAWAFDADDAVRAVVEVWMN